MTRSFSRALGPIHSPSRLLADKSESNEFGSKGSKVKAEVVELQDRRQSQTSSIGHKKNNNSRVSFL